MSTFPITNRNISRIFFFTQEKPLFQLILLYVNIFKILKNIIFLTINMLLTPWLLTQAKSIFYVVGTCLCFFYVPSIFFMNILFKVPG